MADRLAALFAALVADGRIADLILALVALEALVLLAWRARRGHGPSPAALVANLAAGACLLLALRGALQGAHWTLVAAPLAAAGLAHSVDLWLRFAGGGAAQSRGRSRAEPASGTSVPGDAFTARR